MKAIDRVFQYLDKKGIKHTRAEKNWGLSNGYLNTQKVRNADLGEGALNKIIDNSLDMSPEWLLTGKGEMLRGATIISSSGGGREGVPLVPIEAIAGKGSGELVIQDRDIEQRYIVPEFSKADFLIRVKGSSMYPKYSAGDILACIRMDKGRFIQWNKTYVIDSTQGIMVKRILKGGDKQHWILRSDNKEYQDIDVNADEDVHSISLVIGVIRLE